MRQKVKLTELRCVREIPGDGEGTYNFFGVRCTSSMIHDLTLHVGEVCKKICHEFFESVLISSSITH